MPIPRTSSKRRASAVPAPAEAMICIPCSTVPFGSVGLISLLSAIVCVLSVLIVLASLIIQMQQIRLQRLAQAVETSIRP